MATIALHLEERPVVAQVLEVGQHAGIEAAARAPVASGGEGRRRFGNHSASSTSVATRFSRLGRKITSNSTGKNQAMNRPPLCAFQNWLPSKTAAVQLISVPRFLGAGQMASVEIIATNAASTGSLKTESLNGSAQNPSSETSLGKIQPNICRSWPMKTVESGDVNQRPKMSARIAAPIPSANRRMPRCQ